MLELIRQHEQKGMEKPKKGELSIEEQAELDHYFQLEHLMRLAKIRAYQMLHS
ncbi:MAG: hypothetical protein KDD04_11775 [Sinomicrobium sp.]|nr:hypothetical protein [Sinomicrobium sp.]